MVPRRVTRGEEGAPRVGPKSCATDIQDIRQLLWSFTSLGGLLVIRLSDYEADSTGEALEPHERSVRTP